MRKIDSLHEKILSVHDLAYSKDIINAHTRKEIFLTKEERITIIDFLERSIGCLEGIENVSDIALSNIYIMNL
jgi:hypothetical protein